MKILSIRIKNLASIAGEHVIDFEHPPLAHAGLIAIIGKTGAGKSTLLDAMCLALFNQVPRLKHSDGKISDVDGSEILSNSTSTLLRRGCAHGFAEVCFTAHDQKHYLARWEIKRAREKATGKLQSIQRYLKSLSDGQVIADKAKAVDEHIQRITQLSFAQFTRAVLLAQSDVTVFLKARDSERGELLEYLTNSEIFAKVGELAYRKTAEISRQRKELENLLGHVELLSPEHYSALATQYQLAEQHLQQCDAHKAQLEQQQQWYVQQQKFDQQIQTQRTLLQHYQQQWKALAPERQQLEDLNRFAEIRAVVIQRHALQQEQQQAQQQFSQTEQQFKQTEQQFVQCQTDYQQADAQLQQWREFEQQHAEVLQSIQTQLQQRQYLLDDWQHKKIDHNTLQHSIEQQQSALSELQQQRQLQQQQLLAIQAKLQQSTVYSALDNGLTVHIAQLTHFIQHYQTAISALGSLPAARQSLAQLRQQLNRLYQDYGDKKHIQQRLERLYQQQQQAQQRMHKFSACEQELKQLLDLSQHIQDLHSQQQLINQQVQQTTLALHQAEQQYQQCKQQREQLQNLLQQQRILHAKNIEHLREQLQDGHACMVCGSTEHPYRHAQHLLSKSLFQLQQQQEQQMLQDEQQHFELWQQLLAQSAKQTSVLEQNQLQQQQEMQRLQTAQPKVQQRLEQLAIDFSIEPLGQTQFAQFAHLKLQAEQYSQQLTTDYSALYQQQQHCDELEQQIQQHLQHLQYIEHLQQPIQSIIDLLDNRQQQCWQADCLQLAPLVLQHLSERQQMLEQHIKQSEHVNIAEQNWQQAHLELERSEKQSQQQQHLLTQLITQGKQCVERAAQLIFSITQHSDIAPQLWLEQRQSQAQSLLEKYQTSKRSFEQYRLVFEQCKSEYQLQQNNLDKLATSIQKIATQLTTWMALHTEFDELHLQHLSQIDHVVQQALQQRIDTAKQILNDAQVTLHTLDTQAQDHQQHAPSINLATLADDLEHAWSQLNLAQKQRDQVKVELELQHQNQQLHQKYAEQINQIHVEQLRWNKISSLLGDANGRKFRDLAQQFNLDILLEYANQQLVTLSQRYTLKRLDNSLSLAIIDHDMDGEIRSVASLSGGESFLTALALSLAIASMASGTTRIESLFIDEGFGTLDASALHMVMNALDHLQHQGRQVVLISHIQDMHERIPVQIQVNPIGAGASTIRIVG